MVLDAAAEVLLSRRTGIVVRGLAIAAAVAARARLRENILCMVVRNRSEEENVVPGWLADQVENGRRRRCSIKLWVHVSETRYGTIVS